MDLTFRPGAADFARPNFFARALGRAANVSVALLLMLLGGPLWIVLAPGGHPVRSVRRGCYGERIVLTSWRPPRGLRGRLMMWLALDRLPLLLSVLDGTLSLIGPRALVPGEMLPADLHRMREVMRPGLLDLAWLRARTSIDYADRWQVEREFLSGRGIRSDCLLFLRCLLAGLYGRSEEVTQAQIRVDTLRVDALDMNGALDAIEAHLDAPGKGVARVFFANPHCVNQARRNSRYRQQMLAAELVLPDGIGMRIAGKLLGTPIRQNVNGTDLFPRLCTRLASRRTRIFLLGARPGVAERVAEWIGQHHPGCKVVGTQHGHFSAGETEEVVTKVRRSGAEMMVVAMGVPVQEAFISAHAEHCGVRVAMGVGGLFDFCSGRIPRAPLWMREIGLEWVYRLVQEPGRMWRRYLLGNLSFMLAVTLQRVLGAAPLPVRAEEGGREAPAVARAERAIVLATAADSSRLKGQGEVPGHRHPFGPDTIADAVFAQLLSQGCRKIDLVTDETAVLWQETVASAEAAGISVQIHPIDEAGCFAWESLATRGTVDDRVWLVRADSWLAARTLGGPVNAAVAWRVQGDAGEQSWAGWAVLPSKHLAQLPSTVGSSLDVAVCALMDVEQRVCTPADQVSHRDANALVVGQCAHLEELLAADPRFTQRRAGIWVSRDASIEGGVTLKAPLFVGAGVVLRSGASVGPNVSLQRDVYVAGGTRISNSAVLANTFIGEGLDISNQIVSAGRIHAVGLGVSLDASVLGGAVARVGFAA